MRCSRLLLVGSLVVLQELAIAQKFDVGVVKQQEEGTYHYIYLLLSVCSEFVKELT